MQVCVKIALATTAIAATAVAITAVSIGLARKRITGQIRRLGARPELANQVIVLSGLRSGQFQALVFGPQVRSLLLAQVVQNCPGAGVLAVDDVPGVVCHAGLDRAGVGRHTVADVGKAALNVVVGLAAAVGDLSLERIVALHNRHLSGIVELRLLIAQIADSVSNAVKAVDNSVVQGEGAVTDTLLYATDSILQAVKIELGTDVRPCEGALTAAIAAPVAPAVAAETKKGEDHQNPQPSAISAPTVVTIPVVVVRLTGNETSCEIVHKDSPF